MAPLVGANRLNMEVERKVKVEILCVCVERERMRTVNVRVCVPVREKNTCLSNGDIIHNKYEVSISMKVVLDFFSNNISCLRFL